MPRLKLTEYFEFDCGDVGLRVVHCGNAAQLLAVVLLLREKVLRVELRAVRNDPQTLYAREPRACRRPEVFGDVTSSHFDANFRRGIAPFGDTPDRVQCIFNQSQ